MYAEVPAVRRACLAATGLGLVFLAASAQADVKIVSEVTFTRQPDAAGADDPAPELVTTYYKGRQACVEVTGGPVTLYNADSGRVYTLDPLRKTYYVLPLKQVQEGQTTSAQTEGGRGENMEAKVDLKSPDGAETRTYAGLVAREYDVTGSISAKRRESGGGNPLGGIFGGGFPAGAAFQAVAAVSPAVGAGVVIMVIGVEAAVGAVGRAEAGHRRRSAARSGCPTLPSCLMTKRRPRCRRPSIFFPGAAWL